MNRKLPRLARQQPADMPPCLEHDVGLTAYDALDDAALFAEPLRGMRIRELRVPGIFRHFFGPAACPPRADAALPPPPLQWVPIAPCPTPNSR